MQECDLVYDGRIRCCVDCRWDGVLDGFCGIYVSFGFGGNRGAAYTSISQSWVAGLAGAYQDNVSGAQDLDFLCIKGGSATSITQLADG